MEYNLMIKKSFENLGIKHKNKISEFKNKLEVYTKKEIIKSHIGRKNFFNLIRTFNFIRKINETEIKINFFDVLSFVFIKR